MSKLTINQGGRLKSVPAKHAKILIALGKATLAQEVKEPAVQDEATEAEKPKRAYRRKDMQAEGE